MSLRNTLRKLTKVLIDDVFESQTESVVYTSQGAHGTFDPTTDAFTGGTSFDVTIPKVLFLKPSNEEEDPGKSATGTYRETEVEKEAWDVLIPALSFVQLGVAFTPRKDDSLIKADSSVWNVKSITQPPGDPFYKLRVVRGD